MLEDGEKSSVVDSAASAGGVREALALSEQPLVAPPRSTIAALVDKYGGVPLSCGATALSYKRPRASSLRVRDDFLDVLADHVRLVAAG